MRRFLILKLQGPMQGWGGHTYEDFRPGLAFPSRSALLGLLGACLGIRRENTEQQQALASNLRFAVRVDGRFRRLTDFHTVLAARKVGGKVNDNPVVSRREYLTSQTPGAGFTVAVWEAGLTELNLARVAEAVKRPVFTPSLGRRACPLTRPLFEAELDAATAVDALALVPPLGGVIYSEEGEASLPQIRVRDEPIIVRPRQFASRRVYIHTPTQGDLNVPEQG